MNNIYTNVYTSLYISFFYNSFSKKKLMQYPEYFYLLKLLSYSKGEEDIDGESIMIRSIISDNITIIHVFVDEDISPKVYYSDYKGNSVIFFVSTEFSMKSNSSIECISHIVDNSIFIISELFKIMNIKNINKVIDYLSPLIILMKIVQNTLYDKDHFLDITMPQAFNIIKDKYTNKDLYTKYFENGIIEKIFNDIKDYTVMELLDECKILGCDFKYEDAASIIL